MKNIRVLSTLSIAALSVGGALAVALQGGYIPIGLDGDTEVPRGATRTYTVTIGPSPYRSVEAAAPYNVGVQISATNPSLWSSMPPSVTVPSGQDSITFQATANSTYTGVSYISAKTGGVTIYLPVTIE